MTAADRDFDDDGEYGRHKDKAAKRQATVSAKGRDIPELPQVAQPKRREKCRRSLAAFLTTYFPLAFPLKWSPDHLKVIAKVEQVVLQGGLFALAMPRGSGKTTICERAVLWAVLYGHHKFAMLVGATAEKAEESVDKIKGELESNDLLFEDFPEACIPCRRLEGLPNRAAGQTYRGNPTRILWGKRTVVLATIPDAVCSGAIIKTGAIKSAVRGANVRRRDGSVERPTVVLMDDPQTRGSAKSLKQTAEREQVIAADVLGLAGPGKTISALMTCTVIEPDDVSDRILNRQLHPQWQGERMKLLYQFPKNMGLWDKYWELATNLFAQDATPETVRAELNALYRKHRKAMDEGGVVAWEERKEPQHLSALQCAMELFYRDPEAFASEYQNEPLTKEVDTDELQTADQIVRRVNAYPRNRIPLRAQRLTAFVDVHDKVLYWMICWWDDDFTGGILDYGTWPDQRKSLFTQRAAQYTLKVATKKLKVVEAIKAGCRALFDDLLAREWNRDADNAVMKIDRILVDAGYQYAGKEVRAAVRETAAYPRGISTSHGKGIKETDKPMSEWAVKSGKPGFHYRRQPYQNSTQWHTLVDTNFWKTFVHEGLSQDPNDSQSISLFQAEAAVHRLLAQHLTAESRVRKSSGSQTVDIWTHLPAKPDNHWFDCLVGCAVAARELGCQTGKASRLLKPKTTPAPRHDAGEDERVSQLDW